MKSNQIYIIDFDSTFTQVEALDELAKISLKDNPKQLEVSKKIEEITQLAMAGDLNFKQSLDQRINLVKANKVHLDELIEVLKEKISISFKRNVNFLKDHASQIYIVSNGFKAFIVPIVTEYGILESHVFANTFTYNQQGDIMGFDESNILTESNGKSKLLKKLNLKGDIYMIGDGYNDYEVKAAGLVNKFYAFTENVKRKNVMEKADHITPSLDEFLYLHHMNTTLSYPKNRIKVLLLENIHPSAKVILEKEGYEVLEHSGAMDAEELKEKIKDISIIGIRSKTQLTEKVLQHAKRLIAVSAFCIGTNQIDLEACAKRGIPVFNAPYSNTRSVVELAIGEIILLLRNVPDKIQQMHLGKWNKSATRSYEIRGKKLGIIGYGNIGAQLSVLAESLGFDVYYYDVIEKLPLGNVTKCDSLKELLQTCEVISLHLDGRPENKNFIDIEQFDQMQEGSVIINLSRGHVVNLEALRENILSGKIIGAAIDVYPEEPKTNDEAFESILKGLPNVILTPHIGGSTLEAQENIAQFVPQKLMDYINTGSTTNSVNFPNLQLPILKDAHRLIHIHYNTPGILAKINELLAKHQINIDGQYLKTNETIGYVITDVNKAYDESIIKELKNLEGTIKFRVLY
ncbi:phosphoglycerate dehydrogenase [Mesonia sp. K4-1]|jgi:D-3-phosphoglycerate dehydrogenase|uniref:phosphoglycerate dehydrogenase n=1 Tax=Mesonia sp. K4-1 TaxID=2602760 RepID=UPI0011C9A221|nr:phosphoglycerate dehydrogenase [Mesonia sp. K4-1]TXK79371.1 phosphoglycerate dehydrogenase [Mesonia sp. K4-1]